MSLSEETCCFKLHILLCGTKRLSAKKRTDDSAQALVNNSTSIIRSSHQRLHSPSTPNQHERVHRASPSSFTFDGRNRSRSTSIHDWIVRDIILYRHNPHEQLGLTLSYGITSDLTTNIYIEKIEEKSLADRQGEFRVGDQIVQINNQTVLDRQQAIEFIHGVSLLIFRILRVPSVDRALSRRTFSSADDSGILSVFQQQKRMKRRSNSCPSRESIRSVRRCHSLDDVHLPADRHSIVSSSLGERTTLDDNGAILKPLPLTDRSWRRKKINVRNVRRRSHHRLLSTDDEVCSELKQGRYWTREERKEQFRRSKHRSRKAKDSSPRTTTEDFHLFNRIFLRENQEELEEKPHLARLFSQQTEIEKANLQRYIHEHPHRFPRSSISTTTASLHSSSSIII